jgi:hypothetical protein
MGHLNMKKTNGTPARLSKIRTAATTFAALAFIVGTVAATTPAHATSADAPACAPYGDSSSPNSVYKGNRSYSPALKLAAPFSVLSGAAATIPTSKISGDLGAGAAVTISNTVVDGISYPSADCNVVQALSDAGDAYKALKHLMPSGLPLTSDDLGGQIIHPGTYHQFAAITASSTVVFDGNDLKDEPVSNPVFVIQTDAALNTTAGVTIKLINGASAENIYWVATGAATLGAGTNFSGTIISGMGAVTIGAGSTFTGRAISLTAAATLDSDTFLRLGDTSIDPTSGLDG